MDFLTNMRDTSAPPKHARFGGGGTLAVEFLKKSPEAAGHEGKAATKQTSNK
jgi:hypothetical protein